MKPTLLLILLLAAPFMADAAAPVSTTAPDSTIHDIDGVTVEATRPVTTLGGASGVEVETESLRLPAAPSLEAVLRGVPFLHVRTNSRGEAEISARGSGSRQVAVLFDGIPITLAWDARADVSVLPADAIRDMVFVRGLSSLLHGPNVLGGVVEARIGRSLDGPERTTHGLRIGTDDVGAYGAAVSTSMPFENDAGRWLLRAGLSYRNTPGDPLADGVTEPVPTGDDLRLNTDAKKLSGFLALRHERRDGAWFSLSGTTFRAERGIAAELGVPDDDARLWRYPHVSRTIAVLGGGTGFRASPLGGWGSLETNIGVDRGRTDIDAYTSRTYDEISGFEDAEDRTMTLRLLADQTLGANGDLHAALTLADIRHDEILTDGTFNYRQRLWSAGLEYVHQLLLSGGGIDALSFSIGGAYDAGEILEAGGRETLDAIDEWGGRAGLSAQVADGKAVLHAGASRRGRFPALRELYSGALNRFAPNPDLGTERLATLEGGVTYHLPRGELQVVGFRNRLEDAVVRIVLDDGRYMRVNRDELESIGVEILGSYAVGPARFSASATFQNVKLTDPTAEQTIRSENLPERFGEASVRFPLIGDVVGRVIVAHTGPRYCLDPGTGEDLRLAAATMMGAHLSRAWSLTSLRGSGAFTRIEALFGVENIGDVALYDAFGLPEPGRRFRFEVRLD